MDHETFLRNELDALQDASFDAIFTFTSNGLIIAANDGAAEMFGYPTQDLVGKHVLALMIERDAVRERGALARTNKTLVIRNLNRVRTVQGKRSSGEEFPFRLSVREVKSDGESLYLCVANDLTSEDLARRRVLELHSRLEEHSLTQEAKVAERTLELQSSLLAIAEANRRLAMEVRERETIARDLQKREIQLERLLLKERELSELRSRFVSITSHEFRTPLTAMLSSVEVIAMSTPDASPTVTKHIGRIREHIGYLRNILEEFLQLGKLDVQGTDLHVKTFHLESFFRHLIEEFSLVCLPGQEIVADISENLGETTHSFNGLWLVCTNLITNAIKYSPEGAAIFFTAKLMKKRRLQIQVQDQGMGIPAYEIGHLFERFYRASNAQTFKGTGLGLHIAQQYAHAMGGEIRVVNSTPTTGTLMSVDLPFNVIDATPANTHPNLPSSATSI